jgi:uncharacterized protein
MSTIVDYMSAKNLIESLFPRTRSAIFQHLFLNEEGLHLREIERRSGVNSRHLMRELHSLRDAGILLDRKVGNQVIYRLNPACPIYDDLRAIIRKTVGLADRLREELQPFANKIQLAYVYGSNARGDARSDSDVDLMLVGELSLRQLGSTIRSAGKSLNRVVNPTIYTPAEYRDELQTEGSFLHRVHNGPRIDLLGGDS